MSLVSRTTAYCRKRIAGIVCRNLAAQVPGVPIISFTFDDFPRSALKVGGSILSEQGVRATYYASMGLMGKRSALGEMYDCEDLLSLVEQKHELACHTFNHLDCLRATTMEIQQECSWNRQAVADLLKGYQLRNFSFPSGAVSCTAKSVVGPIYDSCRTVEWGINGNPVDLRFLRANPLYSVISISKAQRLIDENIRRTGWLIFYTHDVSSQPSTVGCTAAYFRQVVTLALASGASVLTVAEAVNRFKPQKADSCAPVELTNGHR